MATFNYRHLIREIPAATWRAYLTSRTVVMPDSFSWDAEQKAFADGLVAVIEALQPRDQATLHAELRHVYALANRRGIDAILNASNSSDAIREEFGRLRNDAERALWVMIKWPDTFMAAEALLQFDLGIGKRSWKRQTIKVSLPVSRAAEDIDALAHALSQVFPKRKGPKRACQVDVCNRYLDGGVQVSAYVEDDPNDLVEFFDVGMGRRTTRPATNLALAYYPSTGIVDTLGRGGAQVHQRLVILFAKHLLHRDVKPEAIQHPMFYLNRLRNGLDDCDPNEIDLEAYGVERIRLRHARFRSTQPPQCDFRVEMAADHDQPCAYHASSSHLHDRDFFRGPYNLIEVLITVYFTPVEPGKAGRLLNIELKHSGVSNLQDMTEKDAKLVERLLRAWRVSGPTDVELALIAQGEVC